MYGSLLPAAPPPPSDSAASRWDAVQRVGSVAGAGGGVTGAIAVGLETGEAAAEWVTVAAADPEASVAEGGADGEAVGVAGGVHAEIASTTTTLMLTPSNRSMTERR